MRRLMRSVVCVAMLGALLAGCSNGSQGQDDAGQDDAGQDDAGQVDAGQVDAGQDDAGQVDAGQDDAGQEDAGQGDAGQGDGGFCGDDICDSTSENADTCPVDCPAVCTDGFCTHDEGADTCPDDCPAVCPDGSCTHDENADTCPDDCPASCPDGFCTHDEDADTCPDDCLAECPDGSCTHGENADTCPDDCPAVCPDGFCTHDEDADTCPDDCPAVCPDGSCTHDENADTCPDDCPPVCPDGFCTHDENALTCNEDCPCATGPCCDEDGLFLDDQTVCGTWSEYRCAGAGCQANAETRSVEQKCSGASSLCDGEVSDPQWQTTDCDDVAEICDTDGTTHASCTPCETNQVCLDGACDCEFCGPDVDHCGSIDIPWPGWNEVPPTWNSELTLYTVPALTGFAGNNGGASETLLRVGNGAFMGNPPFELVMYGIVTFDIADLPIEAKIHTATMYLYQSQVFGVTPYSVDMQYIGVEHIRHEPPSIWGAHDAPVVSDTIGVRGLQPANASIGYKSADITEAVRYELATCQSDVQFRLGWRPQETDANGDIDEARFVDDSEGGNVPYLHIRYSL